MPDAADEPPAWHHEVERRCELETVEAVERCRCRAGHVTRGPDVVDQSRQRTEAFAQQPAALEP